MEVIQATRKIPQARAVWIIRKNKLCNLGELENCSNQTSLTEFCLEVSY